MLQLAKKASEAYQITVKNADGQVMWDSGDLGAVRKTYIAVTQSGYQATATLYQQGWNGRLPGADGSYNTGDWAPEGEYTFTVRGRAVGSDVDSYLSYNFYVDNTRPEVKSAELFEDENGDLKLALTVSDDKYLQFAWVVDSAQQYYYLEAADEFKDAEEGATVRLVLDASDLVQQLSLNAANPGRVGILVSDCAFASSGVVDGDLPEGVTVTITDGVTIGGKLCIEGKLIVPRGAKLNITENAVIIGQENIVYEGCTHEHSKEVVVEATCTRDGSKSIVCQNCGETLSTEVIPAAGHHYEDGKCTDCGAEDPNYQPGQPEKPENPGVKTDDESSTNLWVLVMASAAMLTAAVVALPRRKHSR